MQMTPEDCYLEGEMAYISDDVEGARRAFKRAVDAEPNVRNCFVRLLLCG